MADPKDISIRTITDADLETADRLVREAFHSQASRLDDLILYRKIQPDGWFLATRQGQPAGMVGAANYGAFAHVGLMVVRPELQHQGIGRAIMQFLLAHLEQHHVPMVTLDASKMGRPLYEQLGFVPYDETRVLQRSMEIPARPQPIQLPKISAGDLEELAEWDAPFFGTGRRKVFQSLLELYPGRGFLLREAGGQIVGYVYAQKNRIGPWVATHPQAAERLLQAVLALPYEGPVSIAVPEANPGAQELLERNGFQMVRGNTHMGRGTGKPPGQRESIYAQTSLAVG
jgi:GNAT superfamily N-acetyltransferase